MNYFKNNIFLIITVVPIILFLISCDICPSDSRGEIFEWKTSSPEEHGFDSDQLISALDEAENRTSIYSVIVIHDRYILAERYYRGYEKNSSFNIRSVSKSFLSAITAITLETGLINSLDEKVLDFFPEYDHSELDPLKQNITIKHLLTMQAGIDYERNNYSRLHSTSDWIQSTIDEPLAYSPGERHSYNTFLTHILSGIITKQAEISILDFAEENLFEPLGITVQDWLQSPQGIYFGGNDMFFTTRDMAVLGYLFMNNGEINGVQIIPREWVEESLTDYIPPQYTAWNWGELSEGRYGYLWWLGEIGGYKTFLAIGHGGQFVVCFPEINVIIATNSNAYVDWDDADENERTVLDLVANYILPALMVE